MQILIVDITILKSLLRTKLAINLNYKTMFDNIHEHYRSRTEYVPYEKNVTVHEHRAPTDESLKLVEEIREKVQKEIIEAIPIQSSTLNGCVLYKWSSPDFYGLEILAVFKLNDKEYEVRLKIEGAEYHRLRHMSRGSLLEAHRHVLNTLHQKLAEVISEELINSTPDIISSPLKYINPL